MLGKHAQGIFEEKYQFNAGETWEGAAHRVATWLFDDGFYSHRVETAIARRKIMPGGRYLYAAGRPKPQINNCFLFNCDDSAEGFAFLGFYAALASMKGGGVGAWYGDVRPKGREITGYGGYSSGPISVMHAVNDAGRRWKEGATRRSANWAGLPWHHDDIREFIHAKEWSPEVRALKAQNYDFPADLDQTNISVGLDDEFFEKVREGDPKTWALFLEIVEAARTHGDPGFSIDCGENTGEHLRNPCTEVTSRDTNDVCNLGSINLARMTDLNDLEYHCRLAVRMLYQGTDRSYLPKHFPTETRDTNRRIGVGLLGLHEWCLQRGHRYEPTPELNEWLTVYEQVTDDEARKVSTEHGRGMPAGVRAVAPTGTIGMLAETTTGIEPIFAVAQLRRWQNEGQSRYRIMVNPVAERLIEDGNVKPEEIEDAYDLGRDIKRRLAMQAFVQGFVDMGISSTINLPPVGEAGNSSTDDLASALIEYLPHLRGVTLYPDGAHSGQPMEKVSYQEALEHGDHVVLEDVDACRLDGTCGT